MFFLFNRTFFLSINEGAVKISHSRYKLKNGLTFKAIKYNAFLAV